VGVAGVVSGLFLSILAIARTNAPQALGLLANVVYSSLTFGSLGVLLLTFGGGALVFAVVRQQSEALDRVSSSIDGHSGDALGDGAVPQETQRVFGPGSGIGALAFVQSVVLLALYSGFVQEFGSNMTMRLWVRSNFPVALSVLNWEGVLILAVSLGLLLLQYLPGRFFSE